MTDYHCGRISEVEPGSPADRTGIEPGDELVSIGSSPVRDILDYNYLTAEEHLKVRIRRGEAERTFNITKQEEEELGLEFTQELFDGVRSCRNNCIFCFLHQMPKGMRKSLYIRDDDYRLSFAHGNYITLSNLSDDDLARICRQRMSPIYVSVHTTDPELRVKMLRNPNAAKVMDQLRRMADSRISIHAQIVLVPGYNDGSHLKRTVRDLASLYPRVTDIAIVPVGLTRHREGLTELKRVDEGGAREVLQAVTRWQREFLAKLGTRLVFASDELYMLAGKPFPSAEAYEGFPQFEDGVGVSRLFLDDLRRVKKRIERKHLRPGKYVLVTGTLSAPLVNRLAEVLNSQPGVEAKTLPVANRFLGESVTVAGLLTGQDIVEDLRGIDTHSVVIIPDVMLNEERFLDDMTLAELQSELGCTVIAVPASPSGVVDAISEPCKRSQTPVSCEPCAGT